MSNEDLNEVSIILDHLTLVRLKWNELEERNPRPDNYYELEDKFIVEFDTIRDELIETLISKNMINVIEKTQKGQQ